jgi:hypothetical protein
MTDSLRKIRNQKVTFVFNCTGIVVNNLVINKVEVIDYGYKSKIVATQAALSNRQVISLTYNLSGYEQHPPPPDALIKLIKDARDSMGANPIEPKPRPGS